MRNMQKAGLTDLENQMEQAKFAACYLSDLYKNSRRILLLKENNKMNM